MNFGRRPVGNVTLRSDNTNVALALEYVTAAEELVEHGGPLGVWVSRPACYLLRHAVEVALKHAITWVEIESHHDDPGFRPFGQPDRIEHRLLGLADELDRLLGATGNEPILARVRATVLRLDCLDPDGQRFRYVRYGGKKAWGKSIPSGTRVNLSSLAKRSRKVVDYLIDLDPGRRREVRERMERMALLARTQSLPVFAPPADFGHRRSANGRCVLPIAMLPSARIGQMVRVGTPDDIEITWLIDAIEGSDLVVSAVSHSGRLPAANRRKRIRAGECPQCIPGRIRPIDDGRTARLIAFDSCEVLPKKPLRFVPNRLCPECGLRLFVPTRSRRNAIPTTPRASKNDTAKTKAN